jgi:hypothetical protein
VQLGISGFLRACNFSAEFPFSKNLLAYFVAMIYIIAQVIDIPMRGHLSSDKLLLSSFFFSLLIRATDNHYHCHYPYEIGLNLCCTVRLLVQQVLRLFFVNN